LRCVGDPSSERRGRREHSEPWLSPPNSSSPFGTRARRLRAGRRRARTPARDDGARETPVMIAASRSASASEVTGGARSGPGPSRTDEPGREGLVLRSAMPRTRWAPSVVILLARGPRGRPPGHERRPGATSVASPSSSGTAPVRPSGSRRRPPARPAPERCRRTSPGGALGSRLRGRRPESRAPAGATARRRPGLGRAYRAADVLGRPRAR